MDKREEILESALAHFSRNGFQGTSLSQIAAGAKTQKQLITHHFGTKENTFTGARERKLFIALLFLIARQTIHVSNGTLKTTSNLVTG